MSGEFTISQLNYLLAVDKHRHFGHAAKACHVSQPTLSIQLSKLEDSLGVVLFDRSKMPILPTQVGEAVIQQARKVMAEYQKVFQVMQGQQAEVQGEFTLAVIPTISPYLMPLFLRDFSRKFPAVQLRVLEHTTDEIIQLLERDEIDGALLATPLHHDGLIEKVLYYEPFQVYLAKEHPLLDSEHLSQSDLRIEEAWLLKEGHCFRNQTLNLCKVGRLQDGPLPSVEFESGNFETLVQLVNRNGGLTLLPQLMVETLSANQRKFLRSFHGKVPSREISLVYSRSFLKEPIINALEAEVIGHLPKSVHSNKNGLQVLDIDVE
jgi:LysR family hydrogen peroxide-inducible transcriptional activator